MTRLDGKVAIITGGARGQGAAEGAAFAEAGAHVYLTDVLAEEGSATALAVGATFLSHDVAASEQWHAVVERVVDDWGRIDVLVNNAGIRHLATMLETTRAVWDATLAVNQTGVFLGMLAVAPTMVARGAGSIINISSVGGLRGSDASFAYATTKWAVRGMTRSAARELGPHGVRVNSIHPGMIDTPMLADFPKEETAAVTVPLGRPAVPDEVARMALWLASDEASYANGGEFVIDGGMTA